MGSFNLFKMKALSQFLYFVFIQTFLFNLVSCQQANNAKQEMNNNSLAVARVYRSILFLPFILTP